MTKRSAISAKKKSQARQFYDEMATYFAEFLCAASWGLAAWPYTWNCDTAMSYFAGVTIWIVLSTLIILFSPRDNPPRIMSSVIVFDLIMQRRPDRRIKADNVKQAILRLVLQFIGPLAGYIVAVSPIDPVKRNPFNLFQIWSRVEGYGIALTIVAQLTILCMSTLFWIAYATNKRPETDAEIALCGYRSGAWLWCAILPWGGPSFSLASYTWIQHSFYLRSTIIFMGMSSMSFLGAVFSGVFLEMMRGDRPDKNLVPNIPSRK